MQSLRSGPLTSSKDHSRLYQCWQKSAHPPSQQRIRRVRHAVQRLRKASPKLWSCLALGPAKTYNKVGIFWIHRQRPRIVAISAFVRCFPRAASIVAPCCIASACFASVFGKVGMPRQRMYISQCARGMVGPCLSIILDAYGPPSSMCHKQQLRITLIRSYRAYVRCLTPRRKAPCWSRRNFRETFGAPATLALHKRENSCLSDRE